MTDSLSQILNPELDLQQISSLPKVILLFHPLNFLLVNYMPAVRSYTTFGSLCATAAAHRQKWTNSLKALNTSTGLLVAGGIEDLEGTLNPAIRLPVVYGGPRQTENLANNSNDTRNYCFDNYKGKTLLESRKTWV